jgi:hypothetical protein
MTSKFTTLRLLPTSVDNLYTGYFKSNYSTTIEEALASTGNTISGLVYSVTGSSEPAPEIVAYERVTPWRPGMNAEAVKNGAVQIA